MRYCRSCKKEHPDTDEYWYQHKISGKHQCRIGCRRRMAKYRDSEFGKISEKKRSAGLDFKEKRRKIGKRYYEKHKDDPNFRIRKSLRTRINRAVKYGLRPGSAIRLLGCSLDDFRTYLEGLFKPGMSWDNYGKWHIDHRVPLAAFNLTDKDQFSIACHYTNLQPLWATENISKGSRYD